MIEIKHGKAPLILSLPHTGTDIPEDIAQTLRERWLATKDTDWWIDRLYDFAVSMDITIVRTPFSRTVIDVNRDPGGQSLYPGQITTGLCPLTTFEGEPLYKEGLEPNDQEIDRRKNRYFFPYHVALEAEIERLLRIYPKIVLYDAHAIRSRLPRLFEGELAQFNIGDNSGRSCDLKLTNAIADLCDKTGLSTIVNGRFKGGWITRHYGSPSKGVHALQMELSFRGFLDEPEAPLTSQTWPAMFDYDRAQPMRAALTAVLQAALNFARN